MKTRGHRRLELGSGHYAGWLLMSGDLSQSSFCGMIAVEDCHAISNERELRTLRQSGQSLHSRNLEKRKRQRNAQRNDQGKLSVENEKIIKTIKNLEGRQSKLGYKHRLMGSP